MASQLVGNDDGAGPSNQPQQQQMPSTAAATVDYKYLRLSTKGDPMSLLPVFQRLKGSTKQWAAGLNDVRDWQAIRSGQPVRAGICKRIGDWVIEEANKLLTHGAAGLGDALDVRKCRCLDQRAINYNNRAGWFAPKGGYARVVIGYDDQGNSVTEYVHRLVLWCKDGWTPHRKAVQVKVSEEEVRTVLVIDHESMHSRLNGRACKSKKCVNPHHLEWGQAQTNIEQAWATRRFKRKRDLAEPQ
jgi:hypothetical protein